MLDNCYFLIYFILGFCHLVRFCLSLIITIDTGFRKDVVLVSLFSLFCCILTFIALMFITIAYSYNDVVAISTKDYTYIATIDVTKEDYRDRQARYNKQEYYFNLYLKIAYISFIFVIGVFEETFRTDFLEKTYHDKYGVEYDYSPGKYIAYAIEAILEFILTIIILILKCIEYFMKKKQ